MLYIHLNLQITMIQVPVLLGRQNDNNCEYITEPGPGENFQLAHSHLRPVHEIIKTLTLLSCQCFISLSILIPRSLIIHLPGCKLQTLLVLYAARWKKYTFSLDIENSGVNLIIKYVEFEDERTINFLIKEIVLVV